MAGSETETFPHSELEKRLKLKCGDIRWCHKLVNVSVQGSAVVGESLTDIYLLSF